MTKNGSSVRKIQAYQKINADYTLPSSFKTNLEIYYYKWNADESSNTYTLQQTIPAPSSSTNMKFGTALDLNNDGTRIVIGAENFASAREMKFDLGETTFDLQDTGIVDSNVQSGGVFTATMYNTKFVIDDRMISDNISEQDDFGRGVCIIDNSVLVGAPKDDGNTSTDGITKIVNDGTIWNTEVVASQVKKEAEELAVNDPENLELIDKMNERVVNMSEIHSEMNNLEGVIRDAEAD